MILKIYGRGSIYIVSLMVFLISCTGEKRTQDPGDHITYNSNDVTFTSIDGVALSGTLTTPLDDTLHTAVMLISGSGPDDRDYTNQFGHRPFLVLSYYLTQQGISVLRYDERGVGKSAGSFPDATYENLASDVTAGIDHLRKAGFKRVGLIGHSEGGGVGPAASMQTPVDFLILMAPDNTTADKSLLFQTANRLKQLDVDDQTSGEILETLKSLLNIASTEPNKSVALTRMKDLLDERDETASKAYREATQKLGNPNRLIQGFLDPKFDYRLHHDPKETFRKIRVPVLVLMGDQDGLTDNTTNIPLIDQAFDSTQHEIKIIPEAGHLFMRNGDVPMEQLHETEETIHPEVLTTISDWIMQLNHVRQ